MAAHFSLLKSRPPYASINTLSHIKKEYLMAFDGIVIANLVHDLKNRLEGGKINKIAQPEKDELLIIIKNNRETFRLCKVD